MGVKSRDRIPTHPPTQTREIDYRRNPAATRGDAGLGRQSGASALFPDVLARSDCSGATRQSPVKVGKDAAFPGGKSTAKCLFLFYICCQDSPLMSEMRVSIRGAQFECRLLTRTVSFVCKAGIPLKAFGYLSRPVCPPADYSEGLLQMRQTRKKSQSKAIPATGGSQGAKSPRCSSSDRRKKKKQIPDSQSLIFSSQECFLSYL